MATVVMTHPKLDGEERAVTTIEAFEEVWSDKGWVLVEDAPEQDAPAAVEAPKFPSPPKAPVTDSKIGA